MRTRLALQIATLVLVFILPTAAFAHDGGEGLWGETDDKVITFAGFILIVFFPLLVFTLSVIQGRLERRKDARLEAAQVRKERADTRGGW